MALCAAYHDEGWLPLCRKDSLAAFDLEHVVPAKHLLRSIDRCLDLSDLRQHLSDYFSHTGRPSIDPELMIRMLPYAFDGHLRTEHVSWIGIATAPDPIHLVTT
jgi:hypothetical protein